MEEINWKIYFTSTNGSVGRKKITNDERLARYCPRIGGGKFIINSLRKLGERISAILNFLFLFLQRKLKLIFRENKIPWKKIISNILEEESSRTQ